MAPAHWGLGPVLAAELGMLSRQSKSEWPGGKQPGERVEWKKRRGDMCANSSAGSGARPFGEVEGHFQAGLREEDNHPKFARGASLKEQGRRVH